MKDLRCSWRFQSVVAWEDFEIYNLFQIPDFILLLKQYLSNVLNSDIKGE
jgi:hypothetical protein